MATLTETLARLMGFVDKAEASMAAAKDVEATKARVVELENLVEAAKKTLDLRATQIADLTAQLEKANSDLAAKAKEVEAEKAATEAATKKADETLAALGVDPKTIPAPTPEKPVGMSSEGEKFIAQMDSIEDSAERTAFYRKHKAQIDAAYRTRS
jgi:Tfp pilus assembly protein FimV